MQLIISIHWNASFWKFICKRWVAAQIRKWAMNISKELPSNCSHHQVTMIFTDEHLPLQSPRLGSSCIVSPGSWILLLSRSPCIEQDSRTKGNHHREETIETKHKKNLKHPQMRLHFTDHQWVFWLGEINTSNTTIGMILGIFHSRS